MRLRELDIGEEKEQQLNYEFPPIAETGEERVKNGIAYVFERKWSQEFAAKAAGISRGKLRR